MGKNKIILIPNKKKKFTCDREIMNLLLVIWHTKEKISNVAYMKIMSTEDKIKRQDKAVILWLNKTKITIIFK
jgi:hypothetical protein